MTGLAAHASRPGERRAAARDAQAGEPGPRDGSPSPVALAMAMTAPAPASRGRVLQRACACGGTPGPDGECASCRASRLRLQRTATGGGPPLAPAIVHAALAGPGHALDPATRASMERRLGHDFGDVRVHTDGRAAASARAVEAIAYTVGRDVVFDARRYEPATHGGRRLIAHELAHVVQQRGSRGDGALTIDPPNSRAEHEARRIGSAEPAPAHPAATATPRLSPAATRVARADRDVTGYTMRLGLAARTGLQFVPTNVVDTQVGPVSVQGGLLSAGASRLNVIVGQNLTIRRLARQLLPLWVTATPFTPPGAATPLPLDIVSADELAQALLTYNRYYLAVPNMTIWREGLRLPLPVEIDETTGVATLHPLQIRALATGFDPAWAPLLDLPVAATTAPPAATLTTDVAAFLTNTPTVLARGIHLGARALTNPMAELPFVREVFRQLGAAGFDVALEFMEQLVNREIAVLAATRDGAAILTEVRTQLAAAPAVPSAAQQAALTRATSMLTTAAGIAAQPPPTAARARPEKTVTVDTAKLDGSNRNPAADVALADAIFSQCNVRIVHGVNPPPVSNAQTTAWLGGDTALRSANNCAAPSAEERALFGTAGTALGFGARFRAFYVAGLSGVAARGYSCPPADSPHVLFRGRIVVANAADAGTLAHELGHHLINPGSHGSGGIMGSVPAPPATRQPLFDDAQCTRIHNNA